MRLLRKEFISCFFLGIVSGKRHGVYAQALNLGQRFSKKSDAIAYHLPQSCLSGLSLAREDGISTCVQKSLNQLLCVYIYIFRHPHGLFIPLCHQVYLQPCAVLGPRLQRSYSVYGLWEVMGCCNSLDP